MLIWIIVALITLAALAFLIGPLVRANADVPGREHDIAVYRDQLKELESDLERGLITAEEAESARAEISRRLLAAAEAGEGKGTARAGAGSAPQKELKEEALKKENVKDDGLKDAPAAPAGSIFGPLRRTPALPIALLAVPAIAISLYLAYGAPGMRDQPLGPRLAQSKSLKGRPISELVARVEARLQNYPEDGRGWEVLAPVYMRLERYEDAARAYANALRILGDSPDRLSGFGEARTLADNGVISEIARKAFERAIAMNPKDLRARFWLAVALEQDGKLAAARAAYRELLRLGRPDAPWRGIVNERLAAIDTSRGFLGPAADGAPGGAPAAGAPPMSLKPPAAGGAGTTVASSAPGPSQEDIAAAREMSAEDRAAMINAMVERLANRLEENGDDLGGWLRLVRSYTVLGRRDDALAALEKARRQFRQDEAALSKIEALAEKLGLTS